MGTILATASTSSPIALQPYVACRLLACAALTLGWGCCRGNCLLLIVLAVAAVCARPGLVLTRSRDLS